MAETSTALFRSVTTDAFPEGVVKDGVAATGVLYPDFYERTLPDGRLREPDVVVFRDTKGDEWIQELGGTSLSGVRLLARIRKEFGISVPIARLPRLDTPRKMASHLDQAQSHVKTY